jgi:hypothetical protein
LNLNDQAGIATSKNNNIVNNIRNFDEFLRGGCIFLDSAGHIS